MDSLDLVALARALIDIDSTTGLEAEAGRWLAAELHRRGYRVTEQPVSGDRFNILAIDERPVVVLSTHIDCVPPFFPSRLENGVLGGRGSCDAKGILAAQVMAAERLRSEGERRVGLLFVVGEERGSDGARAAAAAPFGSAFVVNGEPTDNRLARATRGMWRVRLTASGRAAHSSYPELGVSAIEKLIDALVALRRIELPEDPLLGRTHYTVGLMSGGVAPNVVPPIAEAEIGVRTVGDVAPIRAALERLREWVEMDEVLLVPPVRLHTVPGFETAVFPFTTDVPFLSALGTPLLYGPGSVLVAHTDHEHVRVADLERAVDDYVRIARALLAT